MLHLVLALTSLFAVGCDSTKNPDSGIGTPEITAIDLYYIDRSPAQYSSPGGGVSYPNSPESWLSNARAAIEKQARVKLVLHPLSSWVVPDRPNADYDVLLDEDELRDRVDGALPGNPYDGEPESCDLVYFDSGNSNIGRYIEAGYFMPVEDLLKAHAPNLWASFPPSFWESQRIDGRIIGIPAAGSFASEILPPIWIIREDILSKHGLRAPESFPELIETAFSLKSEDLLDTPIVLSDRFDLLDYLFDIEGFRSLGTNLFFFDPTTGKVSSILDEPMAIVEQAVEIMKQARELDISLASRTSSVVTNFTSDSLGRIVLGSDWLAMYIDISNSPAEVYRILSLLTEHRPEVSYDVCYFAPSSRPYSLPSRSGYRNAYLIPTHTDKAVEIVRMFETMNARESYDLLFPLPGTETAREDQLLLYRPDTANAVRDSVLFLYPAVAALCANPLLVPIYEGIYKENLRDYFNRYASHRLVDYGPVGYRAQEMDWASISNRRRAIYEVFGLPMGRFFQGESSDTSWLQTLTELKPKIDSLKEILQAQVDSHRF